MFRIGDDLFRLRGIEACGLALLLGLLLAPSALAQRGNFHLRVRQTATQSLTLIKPSDPDFDGMIDSDYPGLSDEPGYQTSIRPFLVIVRNDTPLIAVAYAIIWTMHYAVGSDRLRQAVYVDRVLMSREAVPFLRSEQVRLISPMFNVTIKQYEWYHSFGKMYPASSFPPSQGLVSVDENVDGVVYGDGSFIGADKTRVLQRQVMARFAARDEMLAALNLIHSSTAPPFMIVVPLEKMFSKEIQWYRKADQDTLLALYVRARGRTAQVLRSILLGRGLAALEKLLQKSVHPSGGNGGNTNRSMFARVYEKLSDSDPRVFRTVPQSPKGP